jgi:endonuclease V-like protein UPF0215 family
MLVPIHLNKPALRTLGIAESFMRTCPSSRLAGVVMRADLRVDGVAFAMATVEGDDATEGVLKIYKQLGRADINAMILSGAVISWFNIIDIQEVFDKIQKPVICLTYEESPGLERYIHEYFQNPKEKLRRYQRLGQREIISLKTGYEVYIRVLGATAVEARVLLNKFTLDGRIPEPVRVARLAARAAMHADQGLFGSNVN